MIIDIICSDFDHPVYKALVGWVEEKGRCGHVCRILSNTLELGTGDLLFLVSCTQIVNLNARRRYGAVLVLHASDLPTGRGWSPHIWEIVGGNNTIVLTLLEAADRVDTGDIWAKKKIIFEGHELLPEINAVLFKEELNLMDFAIENFSNVEKEKQVGIVDAVYPKRTAMDSRLDPHKTIAEQFNLLRVVDNQRYPAFFDFRNMRYKITIDKMR